jgi:hypothetical protein
MTEYQLTKKLKLENPKLNSFLVRHRARSKYIRNIIKCTYTGTLNKNSNISNMFYWDKAPEGDKYWSNLYRQYPY